jgi:hypothetical protein
MNLNHCFYCRHHIHHLIAGNYGVVLCRFWEGNISPRAMAWSHTEKDYFIFCPSECCKTHGMPQP